jgi:hypothetical protein
VERDPGIPTETTGEIHAPIKEQELQPPHWGQKRGNQCHNKNPARGNISSIPLSEEHCWSSRRKKAENPNYRGTKD